MKNYCNTNILFYLLFPLNIKLQIFLKKRRKMLFSAQVLEFTSVKTQQGKNCNKYTFFSWGDSLNFFQRQQKVYVKCALKLKIVSKATCP